MAVKKFDGSQYLQPNALDNPQYDARVGARQIFRRSFAANTWYRIATLCPTASLTSNLTIWINIWSGCHYFNCYGSGVNTYTYTGGLTDNDFTKVNVKIALYNTSASVRAVYVQFTEASTVDIEALYWCDQTDMSTYGIKFAQENPSGTALWTNYGRALPPDSGAFHTQTVNATSLRANWADLAEYYVADVVYPAGTLVQFGGSKEITAATDSIFSVVSSNPAYTMNTQIASQKTALPIALSGRVPVRIIGAVKKFDKIYLSNIPGVACPESYLPEQYNKNSIGIALESSDNEIEKLVLCSVNARV